ncbi:ephrin-A4 [Astyanax mexicanus]|uniref:ephrin-A4 n=1 Tax=Astyanax mexicanus TaxID=7994 RepID=UPI0020CB2770|nr:ephrin-A4 [Astyanax mexicanus]
MSAPGLDAAMSFPRCPGAPSIFTLLLLLLVHVLSSALAKRHVVYWNSTNPRLTSDDYSVQVNLNDYLDILCPHYPPGQPPAGPPETLALYLVAESQFQGCQETKGAVKRWECNKPHDPLGPVRFSEKIQRFTPFSLGFEFLPGRHYYYSSLSTDDGPPLPCMKLRVTVCCEATAPEKKQERVKGSPAPRSLGPPRSSSSLSLLFLIPSFLFLLL